MAFCRKCGKEVADGTEICDICKTVLLSAEKTKNTVTNIVLCVISFLFPIIGLTLFLCLDDDDSDGKVANCGMFAMIGFGFRVLIFVALCVIVHPEIMDEFWNKVNSGLISFFK